MTMKTEGTVVPPEMLREELYSLYSDMFKDEHGVRPRFAGDYTVEELEAAIAGLDEVSVGRSIEAGIEATEPEMPTSGEGWALTPAPCDGSCDPECTSCYLVRRASPMGGAIDSERE